MGHAGGVHQGVAAQADCLDFQGVAVPVAGGEAVEAGDEVVGDGAAVEVDAHGGFGEFGVPVELVLGLQDLAGQDHGQEPGIAGRNAAGGGIGGGLAGVGVGPALVPFGQVFGFQGRFLAAPRGGVERIEMDAAAGVGPDAVEVAGVGVAHGYGIGHVRAQDGAGAGHFHHVVVGEGPVAQQAAGLTAVQGREGDGEAVAGFQGVAFPALARQHVDRALVQHPVGGAAVGVADGEHHGGVGIGPAVFPDHAGQRGGVVLVVDGEAVVGARRVRGQDRRAQGGGGGVSPQGLVWHDGWSPPIVAGEKIKQVLGWGPVFGGGGLQEMI